MLGIPLVVADRSKPAVDEVLRLVLSGGSFGVTSAGKLESEGPGEVDPMVN